MLPDAEADEPDVRRPQPPGVADNVRRDHVPPVPRSAERRPPQAGGQHGAVPAAPLLHAGIRATHGPRQSVVPSHERARAHSANVRRQEHDGRLRPTTRPVPHRRRHIQVSITPSVYADGTRPMSYVYIVPTGECNIAQIITSSHHNID